MNIAPPILACRDLALTVPGRTLCRDVAFNIQAGECWVIVGRNGAGKTTLLQTLAGLRQPAAGAVMLAGEPIMNFPPRRRAQLLGFLPQDTFDAFPATVLEIALGGRHPHVPRWRPESARGSCHGARSIEGSWHERRRIARRADAVRWRAATRRPGHATRARPTGHAAGRADQSSRHRARGADTRIARAPGTRTWSCRRDGRTRPDACGALRYTCSAAWERQGRGRFGRRFARRGKTVGSIWSGTGGDGASTRQAFLPA